jgi:penicillin-binding protein 1A
MQKALEETPIAPWYAPEGMVRVRIDRTSGKLTKRADHTTLFEYFLQGTEPSIYVRDDEVVDPSEVEETSTPAEEDIF